MHNPIVVPIGPVAIVTSSHSWCANQMPRPPTSKASGTAGGRRNCSGMPGPESVTVQCTVTDSGPGIPEQFRRPPAVPEAFEVGGRGIWLAHQLCDEVTMATGPTGTTIELSVHLPGRNTTSGLLNEDATAG